MDDRHREAGQQSKQTQMAPRHTPYLWVTEAEVQSSKIGEKTEPCEENPILIGVRDVEDLLCKDCTWI